MPPSCVQDEFLYIKSFLLVSHPPYLLYICPLTSLPRTLTMDCHTHICATEQKTKTDAQKLDVLVHTEPQLMRLVDLESMEIVRYWVLGKVSYVLFFLCIRLRLGCEVSRTTW